MITLEIKQRNTKEKLPTLRKDGFIPAVFYGPKEPSTSIALKEVDFMKAWKEAGESSVIKLKATDGEHDALIHEVALDPVSGKVLHADFYVVEKGKKIKIKIPIEFEGTAPAVKELGGTLVKVLHEIEIEAEAANLPHSFTVDVSSLSTFESQILAKDIKMPAGVTLVENPEEVIALVSEAQAEEVEAAPVDLSAIEISEKKGKKEEDAEGQAEATTA